MSTLAISGFVGRTQIRRQEGKDTNCGRGGLGWALGSSIAILRRSTAGENGMSTSAPGVRPKLRFPVILMNLNERAGPPCQ
jgi:hypothetical protein